MPVLFKEMSVDLDLSLVSLGAIWGMDPLAGIFVGLPGGLLADRFGIKRTLTVVCILAGVFSALRGFSVDFWTMAGSSFLFGIMAAMVPSIVPKTASVWFQQRQIGIINAVINLSSMVGGMIATMTSATILSPLLGGWRNVLFALGAPSVILGILWLVTGREPQKQEAQTERSSQVPFKEALFHVIRIKEVWILGLISLTLWGANMGFMGYLPLYLRDIGWSAASADGAITVFNGASMAGMIPMVLLANRLRMYKGMLFITMVITVLFLVLLPVVSDTVIWPLLIISSFLRSPSFAITNVLLFSIKGVGGTYGGTAIGLVTSIGMIGAFAAPPLGNGLEVFGPSVPFIFWGGLAAVSLPLFLLIRSREENISTTSEEHPQ